MPLAVELVPAGEVMLVSLGGDLTFSNAARLRDALQEAFAGAQQVGLEIREINEVDLSFLQILCAAYRTARAAGKKLTLLNSHPPVRLRELADAAGFVPPAECPDGCGCWLAQGRRP